MSYSICMQIEIETNKVLLTLLLAKEGISGNSAPIYFEFLKNLNEHSDYD